MPYLQTSAARSLDRFYPAPYRPVPTHPARLAIVRRRAAAAARGGVGDVSNRQIASIAAKGATTTTGILVSLGTIGGPAGAAIAGLIGVGMAVASLFRGCGDTCILATRIVNQAEPILQQNLQHYLSASPRYRSIQQAALNNVDTIFESIHRACSDPSLGSAGQRCISERLVPGSTAPWCPNPGHTGCDWFALYRDPIANDPSVVDDPSPAASVVDAFSELASSGGAPGGQASSWLAYAVPGGLLVLGLALVLGGRN